MPVPLASMTALLGLVLLLAGCGRVGRRLMAGAALFILILAWLPVADGLLAPLENAYPPLLNPQTVPKVDAVVVLGGGWSPDPERPITSQLSQGSAIRLFEGLRLLRSFPEAKLVLSGGSRHADWTSNAQGYAEAAQDMGVPTSSIIKLDTPLDTAQEADAVQEAFAALGAPAPPGRIVLVTTAAHMPRAMLHFRAAGLAPTAAPTQYLTSRAKHTNIVSWLPSTTNLEKSERAWHEYLGLLAWRVEHMGQAYSPFQH